jgi:DNA primase
MLATDATAIVVEGFFDAIALHQAGITGSVAACGSVVNEMHLAVLTAAGAREVCLAFDGDEAGKAAATRAAAIGLRAGCRMAILQCPEGLDPDELVKHEGAEGFRARLSRAKKVPDFMIEWEFRKLSTNTPVEDRVAALLQLATLFASSGLRFTESQVERLAQLADCSPTSIQAFLAHRKI